MRMNRPEQAAAGRALVTGCAGFIGSHLCERLVDDDWTVVGVDCFTPFYGRSRKLRNLDRLRDEPSFLLRELDLATDPLEGITEDMDAVFHLAGQPGARQSFGAGVGPAIRNNVEATARLLGEALETPPAAFVFASSSTIYGDPAELPTPEETPLHPLSPYGRTKVAAEALVRRFGEAGLPTTILRYFSCYGPRQRPDMALARFVEAIRAREPLTVLGDGLQRRDFTYVGDLVEATVRAALEPSRGSVYNVGGGESVALLDAISMAGDLLEVKPVVEFRPAAPGDARETRADVSAAAADLGFVASTGFEDGLRSQIDWAVGREDMPGMAVTGGPP